MDKKLAVGREAVKKFFNTRLSWNEIEQQPVNSDHLWIAFGVGVVLGLFLFGFSIVAFFTGIVSAGLFFYIARSNAENEFKKLLNERKEQEQEIVRLSNETRKIQAQDNIRAFLRVFDRTQIDKKSLRILKQKYMFEKERDLFDVEGLEEKLGDLINKSIRFISSSNDSGTKLRRIYWQDKKRSEWFFNPMRQVTIFISDTQFVICDVNIDSANGDLSEEIQRVSLDTIVSIHFKAERKRNELSKKQALEYAKDVGFDSLDLEKLESKWSELGNHEDSGWVSETINSKMAITRTDGISLSVPIGTEFYFGEHKSALDQEDSSLTEDEINTDRLTNELNRMVLAAK